MLKLIAIGAVIGIANIIPGVSGGTMAVSMGVYDKLIYALTHIVKEWKKSLQLLIPIGIGAGIALVGLSKLITYSLENVPVPTNLFFIGLIMGGMPAIWNRLKSTNEKVSVGNIVAGLFFFVLVVGFAMLGEGEGQDPAIAFTVVNAFKLFLVGIVASATMVIPGVSGSMVLMLMGYYESILSNVSLCIDGLRAFDIPTMMTAVGVLAPFGIGVVIGIVLIAKLVELVFLKFPNYAYCSIMGLIAASPIAIVVMSDLKEYTIVPILIGMVTFTVGGIIAMKLGEK
ncbi:MAG: DUF368 domain-containing protein [Eubacteriales bacterium]